MNRERIKELALESGFKLKDQPDGTSDLNPYVYEFAEQLISSATAAEREVCAKLCESRSLEEPGTLQSRIEKDVVNGCAQAIRARGE